MRITERIVALALVAGGAVTGSLTAQQRDLSLLYGSWAGSDLTTYEARLDRPLGSVLRHGVALQALSERRGSSRSFFGIGYELETPRGGTQVAVLRDEGPDHEAAGDQREGENPINDPQRAVAPATPVAPCDGRGGAGRGA